VTIEFSNTGVLKHFSSQKFMSMSSVVWLFAMTAKLVLLVVVCNRSSHEVSGLHVWCGVCVLSEHVANRVMLRYWNIYKNTKMKLHCYLFILIRPLA
jgi:hypothetical protein